MTRVEASLRLASLASTTQHPWVRRTALDELPGAVDEAHAELVAAGAPEAAELVVRACLLLANRVSGFGHSSTDIRP